MEQIFLALVFLKENQIIHKDLKPSNILICNCNKSASLKIKIADFGLSQNLCKGDIIK
jgi:serine/threonine protein kinase